MKVLHKLTNKTIDKFFAFYHEAFPKALNLPNSYYEAQKITDDLGFTYKTWNACPRSCMLFRSKHANLDACVVCGESRWKVTITGSKTGKKHAKLMSWHADGRTNDGVRRHPANAPAWKEFDHRHVKDAGDIRNIRLGQLYSKVNRASDLEYPEDRFVVTLCHLEKIFPPSFFDIMEHLAVHLAEEALIAGPIQFRWMYLIKRFLLTLKQYGRNKAHPEASIVKGYLIEDCINFCAQYLNDVETKLNNPARNYDGNDSMDWGVGENTIFHLDDREWIQAHRYILFNTSSVAPFITKHFEFLKSKMPRADDHQIQHEYFETFHAWFKDHVQLLLKTSNATFSEEIHKLAIGPHSIARRFSGYVINGFRFHVKSIDDNRLTQNSGVSLKENTLSYASKKDKNPRVGPVYCYGWLIDIVEIRYANDTKYMMFKCDWIDNIHGKKEDAFKFTLVNFNHLLYREDQATNEPYILASQAEQVWYVPDPIEPDWQVIIKMSQRGLYDMHSDDP
ncbi:hypothetical protein RHSIM_Rhsim07G0167400 [Rhododendron simsii]|uniref:Transposase n=1 Tax=Rhododendron simsii TaxID=118357 RepID=A0A834GUI6_RHOSS|nr:hypothetical protein RHSIM_Rhsim07G0167400 [Rhododendron simsii]